MTNIYCSNLRDKIYISKVYYNCMQHTLNSEQTNICE